MEELRRLRKERGLTQRGLADASGVDPATISLVENGKRRPHLETLDSLAGALGVEVTDLIPKAEPSLFDTGEQRRDKYLPWLEFANRYADRWEQRITKGTIEPGAVADFIDVLDALDLGELGLQEKREQPTGYPYSHGPIMGRAITRIMGLLNPLIEAVVEIEEGSKLAQLRRRREELTVAQDRAMSG
jgi:transcriptional regulator with XRE-family HTH domain